MKTVSIALVSLLAASALAQSDRFALHNGDRVVFYGDSITEQRLYSVFTEAYVLTRFPKMNVSFVHSGVGGDRVSGGWMGPIDARLQRDVYPYRPTMVTVMLGMNDAAYRPLDDTIFQNYRKGYESLLTSIERNVPGVRFTLIKPSPYDDVTRPVGFPGGYNAVLLEYSNAVAELAAKHGALLADENAPVVRMLEAANAKDAENAKKIIPTASIRARRDT